ncbi:hypothetical protein [Xanthomonas bonasiae]|uniref:hypothetical protein n=1 Tax=Xanthomonas bonasiae TaxID=2810351 RepID=UPI001782E757|nr:hypothetical protein [Xanthomonas surreyensis]MBD7921782.1 hypothetical protein [Xanthomonas surreyensis]
MSALASFLLVSCAGLAACTSSPPAQAAKADFDGAWSVKWCDQSKPDTDCGGFNLDLVQDGSRLCGSYDSARAGLSQIDEGGRVSGSANGKSAVLTVESERSGGKYVAKAVFDGNQIHWKLGETIREADRDIDIIAIDEKLDRRPLQGDLALKHTQTAADCQAQWGKK